MATKRRPRRTLHASLNPDIFDRLQAFAEETGEPMSRLIDRAIKKLLATEAKALEKEATRAA